MQQSPTSFFANFFLILLLIFSLLGCSETKQNENTDHHSDARLKNRTLKQTELLKKHFGSREVAFLEKSNEIFDQIKTSQELALFYLNTLDSCKDIIFDRIHFGTDEDQDQIELMEKWDWFRDLYPYLTVELLCQDCQCDAYTYLPPLVEKAKNTPSSDDDLFFELLYLAYVDAQIGDKSALDGPGNNYQHWFVQTDCEACGCSPLGNYNIAEVLEKTSQVQTKAPAFTEKIIAIRSEAFPSITDKYFCYSKKEVLEELAYIRTNITLSEVEKKSIVELEKQIKSNTSFFFDCLENNCLN